MLGLLWMVAPLFAQDVPPALHDWQDWVLHDVPEHACPFLANRNPGAGNYQCIWPGRLGLEADKDGGRFSLSVHVDAASWVGVPGDDRSWPQQVSVNDKAGPVLLHEGHPALWLEPGDYTVRGTLPWETRPTRLRVPMTIGLVSLSLDGQSVDHVERNGDQLTLGEAVTAQRQADALSVRVYRHLSDGMPAMLDTQVQLNVTGSSREQLLGPALPKGFVATALNSDLPAQLDSDGRLRVQLRPGQWTLQLSARGVDTLQQVTLNLPPDPWPRQEIWSYSDDPGLRSTHIDGHATDAAQAGVPSDWSSLPAYVLDADSGLTVEQGTRGNEGSAADQLQLQRQIWVDFDGQGLSASDHLTGTLQHTQRLDVDSPWQLQRASQGDDPLLVTHTDKGHSGVELRGKDLDLQAGLRIADRSGLLPSTGWQASLESIDATLHLPYGYRLIGASGVDRSPDSWIAQWSLLDLFIVALIALLAGRLLGWRWALVAIVFLVLSQHEAGAPRWTLGLALAFALLKKALPQGRLERVAHGIAAAALALAVLSTLPFALTQLQSALHPQLEADGGILRKERPVNMVERYAAKREVAPSPPAPVEEQAMQESAPPAPPTPAMPAPAMPSPAPAVEEASVSPAASGGNHNLASVVVTASAMPSSVYVNETDNRSVIQAGAGEPAWDVGNNYQLSWSGPVTSEQTMRLVIAPAWLVRWLRVVMLALLVVLLGRMVQNLIKPLSSSWRGWSQGRATAALLVIACLPHIAHAQSTPSPNVLNQLQARLTEAPKCAPDCAVVPTATVQAKDDLITVDMEVHAGAPVALPMPQTDGGMQVISISVDNNANASIGRNEGQLVVRLVPGVHHVSFSYRVRPVDSTTLNFTLRPQWVSFNGQDWSLDGIDAGRMLGDSMTFNRVKTTTDGKQAPLPQQTFPPYVSLTRDLRLGVDWTVSNTVQRIAPSDGGFTLELPLLPGEHPLGDNVRVQHGRISVTFNASQSSVAWISRLDHADSLQLKAPTLEERAEVWLLHPATIWHVEAKGVPVSDSSDGLRFEPLPDETLALTITRPQPVEGDSLAFDSVSASSNVGDRATETSLDLTARSTRGGDHAISLPAGTALLDAMRDDVSLSLAVKDGKLSLPLLPGKHHYVLHVREPIGASFRSITPAYALAAPSSNISLQLKLPQDRWVLWTWGPSMGPAVLYWAQLVVLLLTAWLLSRYAPTPLRFHHWLLLGLGFSAFAWSAYAFVVFWLILLGLRARHSGSMANLAGNRFNLLQAGLAVVTVLALCMLVSAVPTGLLGLPDMHVTGNGSSAWDLNWFGDQTKDDIPRAGVFSVSLWFYKIAMLAWALWLANALIGWLRWGFGAWTDGGYWRKHEPKQIAPPSQVASTEGSPNDA
ncbi:hypothetical protein ISN74_03475 [Dyella caseinilytica]|uniref:Uncharacterized protein n=2 Tax=Dyella caseinilytica TaxID=1849581 RepID=A0ABX7H0E2_9GAMM|nr:hypothetical protein ISN74_03475 [Dyella caseinilytica]GFZ94321.1 hypothetical protein GCM10011408_12740 [Dyella caseinilytica]